MDRQQWIQTMDDIFHPVLAALSKEELHEKLPTEFHPTREKFALLEAFGRTLTGIAPWLELETITNRKEKDLQEKYRNMVLLGLDHATNPRSKDYMNFEESGQPLVDAAFLAHGIIRAPHQVAGALSEDVKKQVCVALKKTRTTIPPNMNWNLFSAMVEAALYVLGDPDYDLLRVIYALRLLDTWYFGDGIYGDGPHFNFDYYNSYVIQPMTIDLLDLFYEKNDEIKQLRDKMLPRFTRYAAILERLIAPDGSFPVIGRSIVYRFGAFQALGQAALQERLPEEVSPAQVRCGLSAVITRSLEKETTFDEKGWLTPGVAGFQPDLAEPYISIGSLYLCSAVFLPLGLASEHAFWSEPEEDWSAKKVWSGEKLSIDHGVL